MQLFVSFEKRKSGKSHLSGKEALTYLIHLWKLVKNKLVGDMEI
jgi:hypothetical protein